MRDEITSSAADAITGSAMIKTIPPVATAGLILFGVPLSQWAILLTVIYTSLMIVGWVWDRLIKPSLEPKVCPVCGHFHNRASDPETCDAAEKTSTDEKDKSA